MSEATAMRKWVEDKRPDKLDHFDVCVRLGELDVEHYWAYLPRSVSFEDAYSEEEEDYVGVFKTAQNGYKWATVKYPYPSEEELLALVDKLDVSGDDLKKDKWTLLAEAYIKAQA